MEKIERFAWEQLRDYLLSVDALGVPNAIQALLDADEPAPLDRPTQPPRYIPKGVPCVVWDDKRTYERVLEWSNGDGTFTGSEDDIGNPDYGVKWDHARPVCFPEWEEAAEGVKYMCLRLGVTGVWTCDYGADIEDTIGYDYYETRLEVTK